MYKVLIKNLLLIIGVMVIWGSSLNVAKADIKSEVKDFILTQQQDVLKHAKSKPEHEFLKYLNTKAENYLAVNAMGLWALGPQGSAFTIEQKKAFLKVFKNYIVNFYGKVFYQNKDATFKLTNVKELNPLEAVASYQVLWNNQNISIEWKVRKSTKENKLLITDMIVNGISFVQAKRTEYTSILPENNNNPNKLINAIKVSMNKPLPTANNSK